MLWKQAIFKAVRPKSGPKPFLMGLAIQMSHKFSSKYLINRLHSLGVSESYQEVLRYKWAFLKAKFVNQGGSTREDESDHDSEFSSDSEISFNEGSAVTDNESDSEISFGDSDEENDVGSSTNVLVQCVADNLDLKQSSVHGNISINIMGRSKVTNPSTAVKTNQSTSFSRIVSVSRTEKSEILEKLEVKIQSFTPNLVNSLESITFSPYDILKNKLKLDRECTADSLWTVGWVLGQNCDEFRQSNWKGFMKSFHKPGEGHKSSIEFLPVINAKADSFNTVFTTIMECRKEAGCRTLVITFDYPLWVKATRIVLDTGMPVVVRLGGFHLLKSFLGCIGYIMRDSGLEEVFQMIYSGSETVDHILTGGAYYKAIRAHFLVDAAMCSFLLKDDFNPGELDDVRSTINHCVKEMPGSNFQSAVTRHIQEVIKSRIAITSESGRTAKLWAQYHELVQLVKDFIRAERTSDFGMHLSVVADMLPYFAAAGHSQYAKGARLYLELMMKQVAVNTDLGRMFRKENLHTVRYSTHEWGGVPTDLSIEQTLMRQVIRNIIN